MILLAGHLCVDLVPRTHRFVVEPGGLSEIGPLSLRLGGSVANTGIALTALGHDVAIAARVGDDELGLLASRLVARSGLAGEPIVTPGQGTSYSLVVEPDGADRAFLHHSGANAAFDGDEAHVDGADIVHVGYPSLLPALIADGGAGLLTLLERARTAGAVTSLDLAVVDASSGVDWYDLLGRAMPLVDIASPSVDDLRSALHEPTATPDQLVELLLGWGAGVAAVSDGPRGLTLGAADADRLSTSGTTLAGPAARPHTPEDWIASVTTVRGEPRAGLTILPDGTLLADRIRDSPLEWLGAEHVRSFGSDPRLLVKLLDAGQRLPVHAHPDDRFAATHLQAAHGKAEAWYLLTDGTVHLGLTEAISEAALQRIVEAQEVERLLQRMHTVEVSAGDTVFVPPGLLHAIGRGVLLLEVQQPEDLSILVEWRGFELDGARHGHLGLGFPTALRAIDRSAAAPKRIESLIRRSPGPGPTLADDTEQYFRLDRIDVAEVSRLPEGFGVFVVVQGDIVLNSAEGDVTATAGSTVLVPASSGPVDLVGRGRALLCRPPASTPR
ncbi:MAG: PfkB family carbohydrate kinase [Humibacter sp.]